jgi:predicted alpha/beta superfamily hydrolase
MPEMVLVGISNAKHRTRDLTISKITTNYGMPYNEENGEAINFLKFIEEELIPYVESQYRVTNYKTLIGHSYGGLFTIYALLNRPNLFSNYIAIDPSLDWDNQKLLIEAEAKLSSYNFQGKSLFMSLGGQLHLQDPDITLDNLMQDESNFTLFARSNLAFSEIVEQNKNNGLFFDWKFYPNDLHGTVAFPSIMDGLISVFDWYQMENTYKINSFDTSIEELSNIINYREEKLKTHFGYSVPPYPEELLNMSGYMNMDMNQMDKAKMYFDLTIKYFPESANAYDSMAYFYERNGDNQNAIKFVTKAFEISKDDYYKNRMEKLKK